MSDKHQAEKGSGKSKKAARKGFLQGVGVSVGLVTATFVMAQCMQIDALRKIADYRAMYEDYRNQTLQLKSLSETELIDQFANLIDIDLDAFRAQVERASQGVLQEAYGETGTVISNPGGAAIERVGGLQRGVGGNSGTLSQCWRQQYGSASIERSNRPVTAIIPRDSQCQAQQEPLQTLSVQKGPQEGTLRPNTALETEVTRSVYYGDYPVLTVLRADLSWVRDNPKTWYPMRFSPETNDLTIQHVARQSSQQQRIAAFMAGRGLNYVSDRQLTEDGETLRWYEDSVSASQALSTLGIVYGSFAAYPTSFLDLLPIKRALVGTTPEEIDKAQEGDRKALISHFDSLQSAVEIVKNESDMRYERLLGLWVAQRQEVPEAQ